MQVYYKLDNGSNVCGLEFNFTRRNDFVEGAQNTDKSNIGDDVSYDKQIFQQFSHGFEVESEEGRSVFTIWNLTLTFLSLICHLCDSMTRTPQVDSRNYRVSVIKNQTKSS